MFLLKSFHRTSSTTVLRDRPHLASFTAFGLTAVLLFLWSEGFQLRVLRFSDQYQSLRVSACLLLAVIALCGLPRLLSRSAFANRYVWAVWGIFLSLLIPTYFTAVLRYHQGLVELLRLPLFYSSYFVLLVLLLSPLATDLVQSITRAVLFTTACAAAVLIAATLVPDGAATFLSNTAIISARYGRPRYCSMLNDLIGFSLLHCVVMLFKMPVLRNTAKAGYILVAAICAYYLLFLYMGRVFFLVTILVMLAFIFTVLSVSQRAKFAFLACLVLTPAAILSDFSIIDAVHQTVDSLRGELEAASGGEFNHRSASFRYYAEQFTSSNYVGIGLVSSTRGADTDIGVGMNVYRYNPADLGIVGVFLQFGFPSVVLTVCVCAKLYRDLHFISRFGAAADRAAALAIALFLTTQLLSLNPLFFWYENGLEWGLMFFMVSHMRKRAAEDRCKQVQLCTYQLRMPVAAARRAVRSVTLHPQY